MNHKRLLTYYASKRLEALADVDDYDAEKLTLSRFGVTDDGLEYVEAEDKIGRECLGILQVK